MTKEQLQEYKENDGWSDDESTDGNEASLSFGGLCSAHMAKSFK